MAMAKSSSVWGIEIGQSALKALRCKLDGDQVVAEAFDYIEYPKILSQPESDPESMVREALETFVNRNDLTKTSVALSVPGQSGLAKFFKPPPVELKKIPDIVRYEARQQIPFDLDDVIWDYQLMAGGDISEGFALESEVGLFAMKRDAVYRALRPLQAADIEVELLQLAPLSIYNMITYDRSLAAETNFKYDTDHPPKSTVVLAMGTDATDLIVTNGYRVWQRSMPLGGNHFTRQLTKDLKLTFAKAEHLKRNAMEADDPKLVFQAMRPVFNDLVTEVQRSMGFFRSLNKKAEIGSIIMLGNSVRLPGLAQYLSKNLAMDVEILDGFTQLSGEEVTSAPAFKDHLPAFGPVYGLCLQALGKGPIVTSLIPKEVLKERLIRAKKPWAVAAAAALLLGFAGNLLFAGSRWAEVHPERWQSAMTAAESTKKNSDSQISEDRAQVAQVELLTEIGKEVSGSADRRLLWMELLAALSNALGRTGNEDPSAIPDPLEVPYKERTTIHVTKIDSKYYDDLTTFTTERMLALYEEDKKTRLDRLGLLEFPEEGEAGMDAAADAGATAEPAAAGEEGNAGWVIQIDGYHYHNDPAYAATGDELEEFVLKTLVHELETGSVMLPVGPGGEEREFTYQELGLSYPFVRSGRAIKDHKIPNPEYQKKYGAAARGGGGGGYGPGGEGLGTGGYGASPGGPGRPAREEDPDFPPFFEAPKYTFKLQVIWREQLLSDRIEAQEAAAAAAAEAAENADENLAAN